MYLFWRHTVKVTFKRMLEQWGSSLRGSEAVFTAWQRSCWLHTELSYRGGFEQPRLNYASLWNSRFLGGGGYAAHIWFFLVDFMSIGGCNPHQIELTLNSQRNVQNRRHICFDRIQASDQIHVECFIVFSPTLVSLTLLELSKVSASHSLKCKVCVGAIAFLP